MQEPAEEAGSVLAGVGFGDFEAEQAGLAGLEQSGGKEGDVLRGDHGKLEVFVKQGD